MSRILIVEDDQNLRQVLDLRLRANGHETVLAEDGISAVAMMRMMAHHQPDVLLVDIGLPGIDGFAVMQRASEMATGGGPAPVIVVTGRDPTASWARAKELGAVRLLQKPVDNAELLAAINEAVGPPSGASADAPSTGLPQQGLAP